MSPNLDPICYEVPQYKIAIDMTFISKNITALYFSIKPRMQVLQ